MHEDDLARHTFKARNYPLRVHSGTGALAALPLELERLGASRALILCGRSIREKSNLIQRIEELCAGRVAGVYAGIGEGAPAESIEEAAEIATELNADALIPVGAGSVIKGGRVVAMLLGEGRPLLELATEHRPDQPPVSRRLMAPKLPILNVLTAPTSGQNRGGSAVRYHGTAHHLEFFDPKTRPQAVFWDPEALATAPLSLMRSTSFEVYWWALMGMGVIDTVNPLVQSSRSHAWTLAYDAYPRLQGGDPRAQIDLCAAALLQNRDEEDGGRPWSSQLLARAAYASSVALFNGFPGVTQSRGYAAFGPNMVRELGAFVPQVTYNLGRALGVDVAASNPQLPDLVADAMAKLFSDLGWPTNLADCNLAISDAPKMLQFAVRNYNANHDRLLDGYSDAILRGIERTIKPI